MDMANLKTLLRRISRKLQGNGKKTRKGPGDEWCMAPISRALALEPRILLDGAGLVTIAEPFDNPDVQDTAANDATQTDQQPEHNIAYDTQVLQDALAHIAPQADDAAGNQAGSAKNEVAFIDPNIQNYQSLIDGIRPEVEIIIIDGNRDGFAQMAEILSGVKNLDAIHIFSHGSSGQIRMGTVTLETDALQTNSDMLQTIKNSLTEKGDVLVYGCNVASGDTGNIFLGNLSTLTGSDIAASDDPTGSADSGGDWVLEKETGPIETVSAVNAQAISDYHGLLGAATDISLSNYDIESGNSLINTLGGGGFDTQITTFPTGTLDDGYKAIDISSVFGSGLKFGGTTYNAATQFYVGTNGYVTFGHGNTSFSAVGIPGYTNGPMIAAQFDDIDLNAGKTPANTSPGGNSTGSNDLFYDIDVANKVITITYDDVGAYSTGASEGDPTTGNAFQIRLHQINGSDFAIELRYENISWIKGGSSLPTGGWTAGDQTNYGEVTGSGTSAFLNLESASNIGQNGVFVWEVRNGSPLVGQNVIPENAAAGTFVSALEITDADAGETHTCSLVNDDGGRFEIYNDGGTWKVRVASGATFDYETSTTRTIRVKATGDTDGLSFEKDLTINLSDVNEAPTAADKTVTFNEDTSYTFASSDFNFSDQDSGAALSKVKITSLESSGTLEYNNSGTWQNVTLNQEITKADIDAGKLRFAPEADANDSGYDSFGFKVNDGTYYSASAYTMTIDVTAVNDAPTAANKTVTTSEDTAYAFASSDFNFTDVDTGDALSKVKITSLESSGALEYNNSGTWQDVTLNQEISKADIDANKLRFTPAGDANGSGYDSFGFKVSDGTEYSASAYTVTVDVTAVNDAPTAANKTVTTSEDTARTFASSDFNFADVDTGDALSKVKITSPESAGALEYNNSGAWQDVTLNQEITKADIDAGKLRFNPAANANGSGYDSFGFKVSDGTEYSASAYTVTVDVTAVNDVPTAANKTVTTSEDTAYIFASSNFNFADVDTGDALSKVKITSLESAGALEYSNSGTWQDVTLNQEISKADIDAGKLRFNPAANANGSGYDSFGFKVSDGTEYSASAYTVTVDVTPVNDVPTGITLSADTISENSAGETVGTLSAREVDTGDTATFTITGDDSGLFEISGSALKLKSGSHADFETASSHDLSIRVKDSGNATYDKTFTVSVRDVNEFPLQNATPQGADSPPIDISFQPTHEGNQVVAGISGLEQTGQPGAPGQQSFGESASGSAIGNTSVTPSRSGVGNETPDSTGFSAGTFTGSYSEAGIGAGTSAPFPGIGGGDTGNLSVNMGMPNQATIPGESVNFGIPGDAFTIQNKDVTLTYQAMQADGSPLPQWLSFSPETGTFTGTPPAGTDQAPIEIKVFVKDAMGNEASTTFKIELGSRKDNTPSQRQGGIGNGQTRPAGPEEPSRISQAEAVNADAEAPVEDDGETAPVDGIHGSSLAGDLDASIFAKALNDKRLVLNGKPSFSSQIIAASHRTDGKFQDMLLSILSNSMQQEKTVNRHG